MNPGGMRLCWLLAVTLLAPSAAVGGDERELQRVAATDVRVLAGGIQEYASDHNKYPAGPKPGSLSVEAIESELVPSYLTRLPRLDPWGQPYWYWTNGEHFVLGSGGPDAADKRWRAELAENPRGAAAALDSLCNSPGQGAVFLVDGRFCALSKDTTHGGPLGGELTEKDRAKLTAREVRAIAVAVTAYAVDNNTYPVVTDGPAGVEALRPLLEPHYARGLSLSDAWGHPYLYWSEGNTFVVYSTGSDGEDRPYVSLFRSSSDATVTISSVCIGRDQSPGADVVFVNGEPCRWPDGAVEEKK